MATMAWHFVAGDPVRPKKPYASEEEARAASVQNGAGQDAYRCSSCNAWHLGGGKKDRRRTTASTPRRPPPHQMST